MLQSPKPITVMGLGFVGLTTALGLAEKGHKVFGLETNKDKFNCLLNGDIPFHEPHLKEALNKNLNKSFILANRSEEGIRQSDIIVICVGTPNLNGKADLSCIFDCINSIMASLKEDDHKTLVIKSTVPPSTAKEKILPFIKEKGFENKLSIVNNPEFLREGFAWSDFMFPDRIVIGADDHQAALRVEEIYKPFSAPIHKVSLNTAEFIKYLSNSFLANLISFSNEMSMIAHTIGNIDIANAFQILHEDKRWNGTPAEMKNYVYPGCGYGGYCLPKDTEALYAQALEKGFEAPMLKSTIQTNASIKDFHIHRIKEQISCQSPIGILGLSFKPHSDDVRDSSAKEIIEKLLAQGYTNIIAYDPLSTENFKNAYHLPITYSNSLENLVNLTKHFIILTAWPEFNEKKDLFKNKNVFDLRYCLTEKKQDTTLSNTIHSDILESTKKYSRLIHNQPVEFIPGETRIQYSGRIFDEKEVSNLIDSSLEFYLTAGRYDKQFTNALSAYLSTEESKKMHCITVNSGSSANLIALATLTSPKLKDLALQEGDEVITVAAGFPTTIAPIIHNKLTPVFIDIELGSYNINTKQIEEALSKKTKAIFIAHTLGIPFDLDEILEIAEKHKLWVIEDNCDALGAQVTLKREYKLINNKSISGTCYTGTIGHIGTSSFYPAHQITMGEGGAVYTNSMALNRIMLSLRDWGRDCWCDPGKDNTCKSRFSWKLGKLPEGYDHKYTYSHIGYNLKITDMQAAVGLAQLEKLPSFVKTRQENWNLLLQKLSCVKTDLILPIKSKNAVPSPFGFALTVKRSANFTRNDLSTYLESKKIQTRNVFAGNMLRQPAFTDKKIALRINESKLLYSTELTETHFSLLQNTDKVMNNTFFIGVYPGITPKMIDYMANHIISFVESHKISPQRKITKTAKKTSLPIHQ